jgi:hypothetical protein
MSSRTAASDAAVGDPVGEAKRMRSAGAEIFVTLAAVSALTSIYKVVCVGNRRLRFPEQKEAAGEPLPSR